MLCLLSDRLNVNLAPLLQGIFSAIIVIMRLFDMDILPIYSKATANKNSTTTNIIIVVVVIDYA
jgi:hypothetical protein